MSTPEDRAPMAGYEPTDDELDAAGIPSSDDWNPDDFEEPPPIDPDEFPEFESHAPASPGDTAHAPPEAAAAADAPAPERHATASEPAAADAPVPPVSSGEDTPPMRFRKPFVSVEKDYIPVYGVDDANHYLSHVLNAEFDNAADGDAIDLPTVELDKLHDRIIQARKYGGACDLVDRLERNMPPDFECQNRTDALRKVLIWAGMHKHVVGYDCPPDKIEEHFPGYRTASQKASETAPDPSEVPSQGAEDDPAGAEQPPHPSSARAPHDAPQQGASGRQAMPGGEPHPQRPAAPQQATGLSVFGGLLSRKAQGEGQLVSPQTRPEGEVAPAPDQKQGRSLVIDRIERGVDSATNLLEELRLGIDKDGREITADGRRERLGQLGAQVTESTRQQNLLARVSPEDLDPEDQEAVQRTGKKWEKLTEATHDYAANAPEGELDDEERSKLMDMARNMVDMIYKFFQRLRGKDQERDAEASTAQGPEGPSA